MRSTRVVDPGSCKSRLPSLPEIALWLKETVKFCEQEHFYRTQSETRRNERLLGPELGVLRHNQILQVAATTRPGARTKPRASRHH